MSLSPLIGLIPFVVILIIPNKLEDTTHSLNLSYIPYGCDCANWRINKIDEVDVHLKEAEDVFLDPKTTLLCIPDSLRMTGTKIVVIGKFYKRKGFPKDYFTQELPDKARVFQYADYKVISVEHSGY